MVNLKPDLIEIYLSILYLANVIGLIWYFIFKVPNKNNFAKEVKTALYIIWIPLSFYITYHMLELSYFIRDNYISRPCIASIVNTWIYLFLALLLILVHIKYRKSLKISLKIILFISWTIIFYVGLFKLISYKKSFTNDGFENPFLCIKICNRIREIDIRFREIGCNDVIQNFDNKEFFKLVDEGNKN